MRHLANSFEKIGGRLKGFWGKREVELAKNPQLMNCQNSVYSVSPEGFKVILPILEQLSSFDLWRLASTIDQMLKDSKRINALRSQLRTGQEIKYFDNTENREVEAVVVEIHRTHAVVRNQHDHKVWSIPFYVINAQDARADINGRQLKIDRFKLKVGDNVGFLLQSNNKEVYGVVEKLNRKTATVELPTGERWRVSYELLFHVFECESAANEVEGSR